MVCFSPKVPRGRRTNVRAHEIHCVLGARQACDVVPGHNPHEFHPTSLVASSQDQRSRRKSGQHSETPVPRNSSGFHLTRQRAKQNRNIRRVTQAQPNPDPAPSPATSQPCHPSTPPCCRGGWQGQGRGPPAVAHSAPPASSLHHPKSDKAGGRQRTSPGLPPACAQGAKVAQDGGGGR